MHMNILMFLIVGGVIGWIASLIMRTDAQQGVILNIIVGIVGSALGGLLLAPLLGIPSLTQGGGFNLASLGVSLGGTVILLALWNLLRRGQIR
jgi:uncharacterized membrane protein YeaQ/YmgE (transglycosylase-associated protein family)